MTHTHNEIKDTLRALNELAGISGMSVECVVLRDGDCVYVSWHPAVVRELRARCENCMANAEAVCSDIRERMLKHIRNEE